MTFTLWCLDCTELRTGCDRRDIEEFCAQHSQVAAGPDEEYFADLASMLAEAQRAVTG